MATKVAPFCSGCYHYLASTVRVPGEEKDEIVYYGKEKPTHGVIYRWAGHGVWHVGVAHCEWGSLLFCQMSMS